jgi:hypothetical protein
MTKTATFGRRGPARPGAATQAFAQSSASGRAPGGAPDIALDVALTPEQRALLFGGNAPAERAIVATTRRSRLAAFVACAAVTALVSVLTLVGAPHDNVAALPPQLEEQAKAVFQLAGGWFTPLTLAWSIFVIGSNLAANLWVTQKVCGWRNWSGFPAFSLIGAGTSVAIAFATALIGLGETEIGYAMEALSGGGAAALYRLLAGRRSFE